MMYKLAVLGVEPVTYGSEIEFAAHYTTAPDIMTVNHAPHVRRLILVSNIYFVVWQYGEITQ